MKPSILLLLLLGWSAANTQPPARTGRDYAVFFYVTAFQPGWTALPETEVEAKTLKTELEVNFGFSCELVTNPTTQQMRQKIREYNARLTKNDQVLYFFSMHGCYVATSDRGYLIGKDGLINDEYGDTWFSYDDLRTDLAPCKARHILLALDACHSGSFGIRTKGKPDAPDYEQAEDCTTRFDKTMRYIGRQYCTSGNKESKTPAKSLFAQQFLEVLRKGGNGKMVGFDDLQYWLGKVDKPKPEGGTFIGYEPGGDFVFVRKNACLPIEGSKAGAPAVASLDRDGDGTPDAEDKCPNEYGTKTKAGCPDQGVVSATADADYDNIPNNRDGCPTEYGTAKANGCPDRDDDSVPDKSDKCPDQVGEPHWQGCPDTDGDGLPDHEDQCPNQRGPVADHGCPPTDRDGDGVPDKYDKCPDQPGLATREGCSYSEERPDEPLSNLVLIALGGSPEIIDNADFILVSGGTFTMGCTSEQKDCDMDEKPTHQVTLSDFYIGQYEVTQAEWRKVMSSNPPELYNTSCDQCPVEGVSWDDVQNFLKKLNAQTRRQYRLPTEAEWEYAARGGSLSKGYQYAGSNNLDEVAWHTGNYNAANTFGSKNSTHPVGQKRANELGLFDMSGNVWEWCSDRKGTYPSSAQTNPIGPASGPYYVQRGGSWYYNSQNCRVTSRKYGTPNYRLSYVGFRLARTK